MADAVSAKARSPLAETTNRINSPFLPLEQQPFKPDAPQASARNATARAKDENHALRTASQPVMARGPTPAVLSPPQPVHDAKRFSSASYASTSSSRSKRNYKTHIGPWQLGRTLGKGSSARVRLCRHNVTNQLAAVKIVNRRMAYLVQDSSLAALSKWDSSLPEQSNGEMRVPMAIEREVAILKLIEHPNIMRLYDIWENRSEIYLILEYIDQGDLFTFINSKGRLSEEVAIFFFRQMISAIAYCHSFNVCHRDLKPENILITADLQIKIADFGMAALHQTDTHQLATACGSPHYAAPELLKNRQYRGDRADIWSLGVILFAMLSATLPFDDPDLRVMMAKTKKGHYEMPRFLSPEAEDLIRRMLQVNPDRRASLKEVWRHPLIQKYSYLDDFGDISGQLPDTRKGFQYSPVPCTEIDPQLLRQLRSMWHMFSEQDLALKLACDEPNDQKAFYWLLFNYRDKQLEDFKPELAHSMSDYHHLKPAIWKKRVSTCQFAQPRSNGHGRSVSRFTVISNAAETEAETDRSYDPFRGSRMLHCCNSEVSQAKIVIHRDAQSAAQTGQTSQPSRLRSGSNSQRGPANPTKPPMAARQTSRGSLASLRSSRQGTPHVAGPALRHKRRVDFSHIRARSRSSDPTRKLRSRGTDAVPATPKSHPPDAERARSATSELPPQQADGTRLKAKGAPTLAPIITAAKKGGVSMFHEELRHFSRNCAKDCDEAFKSSLIEESADGSQADQDGRNRESSPFSLTFGSSALASPVTASTSPSWQTRPLPPLPVTEEIVLTGLTAQEMAGDAKNKTLGKNRVDDKQGRPDGPMAVIAPLLTRQVDRRIVSAPVYNHPGRMLSTLPSIHENAGLSSGEVEGSRVVSAPPQSRVRQANEKNRSVEFLSRVENTIRVVHSPGATSPVKVPQPLNVRKKGAAQDLKRKLHGQLAYYVEESDDFAGTDSWQDPKATAKKKQQQQQKKKTTSWFKRTSKTELAAASPTESSHTVPPPDVGSQQNPANEAARKRPFTFPFWKSQRERDLGRGSEDDAAHHSSGIEKPSDEDAAAKEGSAGDAEARRVAKATQDKKRRSGLRNSSGSGSIRNIEVKQNWLTRLFRVKPATSYICMTLSRKRARQEVVILLREWRRYGIKGLQVDKQRNMVFAQVGPRNYLNLKEVDFAAEIVTVIEHGKKQPLSIVRCTQERGAASTFHRIVDMMRSMFESRNLVVTNKNKQKMMVKTLMA